MLGISDPLEGFLQEKLLHTGTRSAIHLGRLQQREGLVVRKEPRTSQPSARNLARYQREFEALSRLDVRSTPTPLFLGEQQGNPQLLMAYIHGETLGHLLQKGCFTAVEAVRVLLQAATCLSHIHAAQVIHQHIHPWNLIWCRENEELHLIDFAGSKSFEEPAEEFDGLYEYVSPEQTGFLQQEIDARADLYSLGVVAWHMLSGAPPFTGVTKQELSHAHLTQKLAPLHLRVPELPESLSAIVGTLLEKHPAERYQSAKHLAADLRLCLVHLLKDQQATPLPGLRKEQARKAAQTQLVGRDEELFQMLSTIRSQASAFFFVTGPAGIGKTFLVQHLREPLERIEGAYTEGTWQPSQQSAYHGFKEAINAHLQRLLSLEDEQRVHWQAHLSRTLGAAGDFLLQQFPVLAHLVEQERAPVAELVPQETLYRAHTEFPRLLQALASEERPLLLFLDNLQWADKASLQLVEALMQGRPIPGLFVVCAYQSSAHQKELSPFEEQIKQFFFYEVPLSQFHLTSLTPKEVASILENFYKCSPAQARDLALVLHQKTSGNPFFVHALWGTWQARGMLDLGREEIDWRALESLPIADNVVDFLSEGLAREEHARPTLELGACFEAPFGAQEVATLLSLPLEQVEQELSQYAAALILQMETSKEGVHQYSFTHHRLREAVYSRLSGQEKAKMHGELGLLLLRRYESAPAMQDAASLFRLVRHLQRGPQALDTKALRDTCARLALEAGHLARKKASLDEALQMHLWGLGLLGPTPWQDDYDMALALSTAIADIGYFAASFTSIAPSIDGILRHGKTLVDRVAAYEAKISHCLLEDQNQEALDIANMFLREAGAPPILPRSIVSLLWELPRALWLLRGKTPALLSELPAATDPIKRGIINIQLTVIPAYQALYPHITLAMITRDILSSLRFGATGMGSCCGIGCAALLAHVFNRQERAEEFGLLALSQLRRFHRFDLLPKAGFFFYSVIGNKKPLKALIPLLKELHKQSLAINDLQTTDAIWRTIGYLQYVTGTPLGMLPLMRQEAPAHQPAPWQEAIHFRKLWHQLIDRLHLDREGTDEEEEEFPYYEGMGSPQLHALATLHTHLVFGRFTAGFHFTLHHLPPLANPTVALAVGPLWTYALLSLYAGVERGHALGVKGRIRLILGQRALKKWVKLQPDHRQYRLHWVRAAKLRSQGRSAKALEAYDLAITAAESAHQIHEVALIAEQASALCEAQGRTALAQHYRKQALEGYQRWGAWRKVGMLKRTYPQLRPTKELASAAPSSRAAEDLQASLSVTQALTQEKDFQELLQRVVPIIFNSSGAQRLMLLTPQAQSWCVRAEGNADNIQLPDALYTLDDPQLLTLSSALRYVSLTREPLVLNDAMGTGPFVSDPYVIRTNTRSFCCLPLLLQDELQGLLVLENNLLPGVFTEDRVALLGSLGALLVTGSSLSSHRKEGANNQRALRNTPSALGTFVPAAQPTREGAHSSAQLPQALTQGTLQEQTIGSWQLIQLIGQGGTAAVYEAAHEETGQRAAVKILFSSFKERSQIQRFEREAYTLRMIEHPAIVKLLDFDHDPSLGYYLAMEYLEGKPLSYLIDHCAPLPISWMLNINAQLCQALQAIHNEGIIHRDLKPSNVFVIQSPDGPQIKLLDFGIATTTFHEKQTRLTSTGAIVGTPAYLSPEQLKEQVALTPATDLYSLGCIWFEALTGEMPISGGSHVELFVKILQAKPARLGTLRPEFQASPLEDLLEQLFSKLPHKRPQSAMVALDEFEIACQLLDDPQEQEASHTRIKEMLLHSSIEETKYP